VFSKNGTAHRAEISLLAWIALLMVFVSYAMQSDLSRNRHLSSLHLSYSSFKTQLHRWALSRRADL